MERPETLNSAEAESASTSAEAQGAETTESTPSPVQTDDPWADFAKVEEGASTGEQDQPADDAASKTTEAETPAEEEKSDDPDEEVLADLFKEEDEAKEKDGEPKKGDPDPEAEPTEDELDKQDPLEMANAQRNRTAKQYLERTERYAEPLKAFKQGRVTDPLEVFKNLEPIMGGDRVTSLKQAAAHDLVDSFPDATFQRAYAIKMLAKDPNWDPKTATMPSLDDVIAGPVEKATEPLADLSALTADLESVIDWDWRDENLDEQFTDERERTMARTLRQLESQAQQAVAEKTAAEEKAQAAVAKANEVAQTQQTDEQKVIEEGLRKRISEFRASIDGKVLPHVLRTTGLEVSPDDTPEIAAFKQRKTELYQGTPYERENGLPSQFESFLENEWSGKQKVEAVYTRIVDNLLKAEVIARKGDKATAEERAQQQQALDDVKEDRLPLFTLVSEANREFRGRYIDPDLKLLGAAWEKKTSTDAGRERKEIVSSAAPARQEAPKLPAATADDVWNNMVKSAEHEQQLAT